MAELGQRRGDNTEGSPFASEELFQLLFDTIQDHAIFALSVDGRVASWHVGVRRVLGYDEAAFLGLPFQRLFLADDQAAAQQELDRARTTGRSADERWHVRQDGRAVWMSGVLTALWGRDHQLRGYVTIMRDRTAEKQMAAERVDLLRRERTARADAERAGHAKEALLAAVSHELRTPLNAILGWAHLLSTGHVRDEQATRAAQTIERNAKVQAQLIDQLLDMSRIITGTFQLDLRPITFLGVVQAAMDAVQNDADAKQLHVLLSAADPGPIEGDAARLQQVVVSLLVNAIRFTSPNGAITVSVGRAHRKAEVIVRDTGQGMSAEALAHIFDGLSQSREPRRHRAGLGLGLAIARHIVEAHRGTIVAQSEGEGTGATFTVRVPVALGRRRPADVNATAGVAKGEPRSLAGRCALVVEDQADSRTLLDAVLTRCGVRVIAVDSVHDALQALDTEAIDVIISDIGLDSDDGLTLMRQVRGRPAERGGTVPAIAVSAYGDPATRARAFEAGYQTYVAKPLAPAEVTAAVAALVR